MDKYVGSLEYAIHVLYSLFERRRKQLYLFIIRER